MGFDLVQRGLVAAARGGLWLTWGLALGCGGEPEVPSDPAPVEAPAARAHVVDPPPAQVREVEGVVTVAGAAARVGQPVDAEEPIEVPEGGRAALQLVDGGGITLDGPALARVIEDGAAQMLLARGAAHLAQPPSSSSPRPPLRVVTPSATVEIGVAGEAYVALFDGGASWVAVSSGSVAVSNGEADSRRRLRTVELTAGQAVSVPSGRIAEPTEGPRRLTEVREAARALAAEPTEPEPERLARDLQNETQRVDQALRWLETETRRGRELTTAHGAAVRGGQTAEAQRIQRQLEAHSQSLYRLRQLSTARWERLRVQWLRLGLLGPLPASDPVAARRERVTGLLGI
jgi:ribosome-associated protein YbcJ (S4-like RNA binding protein)